MVSAAGAIPASHQRPLSTFRDWHTYLRETHEDGNTNFDLHLRTGRPLGDAEFVEKLEQFVGKSLRPKKGGWPKGKVRK